MSEILGIPDNIPSDLLQKAECVIGRPSAPAAGRGNTNLPELQIAIIENNASSNLQAGIQEQTIYAGIGYLFTGLNPNKRRLSDETQRKSWTNLEASFTI
jgi:hypothetical protein